MGRVGVGCSWRWFTCDWRLLLTFLGVVISDTLHCIPDSLLVVHDGCAGDLSQDNDHTCLSGTL